jgi:hypothetical protein
MKKYSIISLLFIGIVGLFTYMNTDSSTTFSMFGIHITLYNAVWSMLFLSIFYLFSIIYFAILKYKNYIFTKNVKKDKDNIFKIIENRILFKEGKNLEIKELKEIKEFIEMIQGLKIEPKEWDKLPFMEDILKLEKGEIVDLKKYKFDKNNPWVIKNIENGIKKGDLEKAKEGLQIDSLKEEALKVVSTKSSVNEILANNYPISKDTILNNLENNRLKELIDNSNLSDKDYIEIAGILYKTEKNPEHLIQLFENKEFPYIYILIEYSMFDKVKEILKDKEIKIFEYYLQLRECGQKIEINEYLNNVAF